MRTVVFTLTRRYGGLDVTFSRLRYQGIDWLIGDRLNRQEYAKSGVEFFHAPKASAGYNEALRRVREGGYDLMLLLCDYTWIPTGGIQRFQEMAASYPSSILTGLCSHSIDPDPSYVVDPKGLWSIFAEPYDGHQPQEIGWKDVRQWEARRRYKHDGPIYRNVDIEWAELNWAAIPKLVLEDERMVFDEAYDRAFGHENQDFALRGQALGYDVVMDAGNHAIELPHRSYFPEEWAELEELRRDNHRWHEIRRANARIAL
jgi:hypothetical protein